MIGMPLQKTYSKSLSPRVERYFWRSVMSLVSSDIFIGLGFLFQLPQSSKTYKLIDSVIPLEVLGVLLAICGFLFLIGIFKLNRTVMAVALSAGGAIMLMFSFSFILSAFSNMLTGFPAIILWGLSGYLHLLAVSTLPNSNQLKAYHHDRSDII